LASLNGLIEFRSGVCGTWYDQLLRAGRATLSGFFTYGRFRLQALMMTISYSPPQTAERVQGQTASGPCLGVSREGKAPLWSQTDRLPGGARGVANDDPASGDERGGRNLPFSG
jgi:hypothetical protein